MKSQLNEQNDVLLRVNDLKVYIDVDEGTLKPVQGVTFSIEKGKTLGIVGESGCGKSLTSKAILGINPKICKPMGEIIFNQHGNFTDLLSFKRHSKELRSIRGGKISMIFQEPMTAFSPMYTIGNQIMENILLHRTKNKKEAKEIAINILEKVGIANAKKRVKQYPHEFSGGMLQRAMIAMALSCNPELLIADEPTTALDVTIQAQVLELMKELQKELGMAILFITHDLGTVAKMCDEVAVMYLGKVVERASVHDIFNNPKHPYTKGLLRSVPKIGKSKKDKLLSIEGTVPVPIDLPPMCGFHDRCDKRMAGLCNQQDVPETLITENHHVRCFLYDDKKEREDVVNV